MTMKTYNEKNKESTSEVAELKCAHCNSKVTKASFHDKESDSYFCCEGCYTIYQMINSQGLGAYYTKRDLQSIDPVDIIKVSGDYFSSSTKSLPNGEIELTVLISNIKCAACVWLIENSLLEDKRIKSIRINYSNHKAKIIFSPIDISLDNLLALITRLGYCPLPYEQKESVQDKQRKDYFYRFATAAFFSMQLMLYSAALYTGYFQGIDPNLKLFFHFISFVLATPVIFYSAYPFFKNSIVAIRSRHWTMDSLVALGSGSAYIYSIVAIFLGYETYFDTAAMIVTLILLGRFIEAGAKQRGGDAVSKLLSLKPNNAKKINGIDNINDVLIIPIASLKVGDYFLVEPNSPVATDGKIVQGETDIDESMLTGEPIPVVKSNGADVFSGTRNITGQIIVKAAKVGSETFLSKIASAVDDAESSKAPIQDIADRFISRFVPFVLLVSIVTFVCWSVFSNNTTADNIMRAVAVLVIACPCAMGLATPLAIISASTKLTETGIVFKGGEAIERFARVNDYYFDKTGTITEGKMSVSDRYISTKLDETETIKLAAITAEMSKHPASKAISLLSDTLRSRIKISEFTEVAGKGIMAFVDNKKILLGSLKLMNDSSVKSDTAIEDKAKLFQSLGKTTVFLAIDNKISAVFAISDTIRKEAKEMMLELKKNGSNVTVLTGDNELSANYLMKSSGLDVKIAANISPFEKADIIKSSKDISRTAMIGDGINDAIALTSASVGISMRNSTDISMESSSAVLLRNDLMLIPIANKICKQALRIIKQNLFWAFSYNVIAIPLAVSGLIHPVMSAFFMSFSSLFVVANSSRLKR